jgi:hypothetical protein
MNYAPLALLVLVTGCPSDDDANPGKLYLAPDGSETRVKLQEEEPNPW